MTVKLAIVGERNVTDPRATRGGAPGVDSQVTDLLAAVEVVGSFNLSPSARARTEEPVKVEYEDDDVLEIEVEGGFKIWTSAKRYSEEVPLLKPTARVDDVVTFDTLPQVSDRGVTEWVQQGLRVLAHRPDSGGERPRHRPCGQAASLVRHQGAHPHHRKPAQTRAGSVHLG